MSADLVFTLIASFAIFFIGAIIFLHNRHSASNLLFFFISLATVCWSVVNYFSLQPNSPTVILWWVRLVLFFAAPHAVLFLFFVYNFPHDQLVIKTKWLAPSLIFLVLLMIATLSPFIFVDLQVLNGLPVPIPGILMPVFALTILGSLAGGLFLIIKRLLVAKKDDRLRWEMMLAGISLSYLFIILTNFVLVIAFDNTRFNIFGPLFMLPAIIGMGYAILRHELLSVKVITTEILIFTMLSLGLVEILLSTDITEVLFRVVAFALLVIFSIFLVRSVLKEVETNKKLIELDQLKSEFLSFASHQLKSPLSIIKTEAMLLVEGYFEPLSEKVMGEIVKIRDSAGRMLELTDNFLDLRKIEAGKMDYRFEKINLSTLVQKMIDRYKILIREKNLQLISDTFPEKIFINGDEQKLEQVLQNLIDNAIKYTERGKIEIKLEDKGEQLVQIVIKDSGIGISVDVIPILFEAFNRDAKLKLIKGTGLGLYIAKRIINDHNGKIWAESEGEGRGSSFFVELPKLIGQ